MQSPGRPYCLQWSPGYRLWSVVHSTCWKVTVSFTAWTIYGHFRWHRMLTASLRKTRCLIVSYFLRRWNCLTGHSSSKSCWLTSRGTCRNLLLETNSSTIWRFIPLACKVDVVKEQENVKRQKKDFSYDTEQKMFVVSYCFSAGSTWMMSTGFSVSSLKSIMVGAYVFTLNCFSGRVLCLSAWST